MHLVVDPWTRESRGFGFVTMSKLEEAERCIKYLNRSVLEGRVITVEKVNILWHIYSIIYSDRKSKLLVVATLNSTYQSSEWFVTCSFEFESCFASCT